MTEEQVSWVKQLKKGNELAAFNLYNCYSKAMYNTLLRLTNNDEVAKDLLQEGFLKAFEYVHTLKDPKAFSKWLKRIVINTGLEYQRKFTPVIEPLPDPCEVVEEDEVPGDIDGQIIYDAILELPSGYRTVLSLYLIEEMTHKEIAQSLGISVSTSKTQLMKAKKILKKKLKFHYED